MIAVVAALVLTLAPTALAQSSASYRISDYAFNSGGHPEQGNTLASPSYHIRLDAIGDASHMGESANVTFHLQRTAFTVTDTGAHGVD